MRVIISDLKLLIVLSLLSLFISVLDRSGYLRLPKTAFESLLTPLQYGIYRTGRVFSSQFDFISVGRNVIHENKALQKQLADLLTENAHLRRKIAEEEALIDQQNSLSLKTFNLLPVKIISKGGYLTIDKGSQDGIQIGQVIVYKDNFIGQVKIVSAKLAWVLLVQDPQSKIAVFAQNSAGRSKGILTGQFGSMLLMDKILHQEPIAVDDLVYSEGTEGLLPRGLIMGKVTKVLQRENEVFKQAEVKQVYNLDDLDVVFVIKDN